MKARATLLAIPLIVGVAFAQSTSGSAGQTQGSSGQSQSGSQSGSQTQGRTGQSGSQADRTGQSGSQGSTSGSQAGSTSGSQADRTGQSGSQAGSTTGTPAAGMSGQPAEMKTTTYRGTLVDLACGSATASSGAGQSDTKTAATAGSTAGSSTAGGSTAGGSTAGGSTAASGSANRSSGSECPATASSQTLGLKMDNGQTVRFDLVGNQRAQDGLKANKGWNKNLTANKPIKVKIHGVMHGDKLIVSSID